MMRIFFRASLLLLGWLMCSSVSAALVQRDHIQVELISDHTQVVAGQSFWVALRLLPDEHWHTYWKNPGDSGLETRIEWKLPQGVAAGPIEWPVPQRFDLGGIINYGFAGETLLLTKITLSEQAQGSVLQLAARANWLVCEDICIPGEADLELALPYAVAPVQDVSEFAKLQSVLAALPKLLSAADAKAVFEIKDKEVLLELVLPARGDSVMFFPASADVIENAAPQKVTFASGRVVVQQQKSSYFTAAPAMLDGLLVVGSQASKTAYSFSAAPGLVHAIVADAVVQQSAQPVAAQQTSLITIFIFAFLGGLILNLMPCVFPVLSLKGLSLVKNTQLNHHQQRLHGVSYTAGVVLSFVLIAIILLGLRSAGENIGWGFQLQSPWFVAVLAYLLFLMGLSLSGFLEFGASFMGVGQSLTERSGYSGSFFTGVLATMVATPCTAPFMGTAMGVAMTQPTLLALLIFAALGLGLAAPFLLIAFAPAFSRLLPKPGRWMGVFKQLMAFPLYLTVIWLLWVLGRQTDVSSLAAVMLGMVSMVFAAWVWKVSSGRGAVAGKSIAVLAGVCALLVLPLVASSDFSGGQGKAVQDEIAEPFSPQRLEQARTEGRAVFINLTADWCITCKVNERIALSRDVFREVLQKNRIVYLKGDWTNRDPQITAMLEHFNRSGVPLYVVYPVGGGEPVVLPQILTAAGVVQALQSAADAGGF